MQRSYIDLSVTFITIFAGMAGAVTTFGLQKYGLTAVITSCVVGLVGAMIGASLHMPLLPPVIFAGSFAGMTALALGSLSAAVCSGLLVGVVF